MKTKIISIATAALAALSLSNCAPQGTAAHQDSVAGAAIGAVGGAIIGHQSGNALEGAAVGAAVGGVTGHHVGKSKDRAAGRY